MLLSALAPAMLFQLPNAHRDGWALRWGAGLMVAGFILHRINVGGISHIAVTGEVYIPALTEVLSAWESWPVWG